jgi:hypothetical protein
MFVNAVQFVNKLNDMSADSKEMNFALEMYCRNVVPWFKVAVPTLVLHTQCWCLRITKTFMREASNCYMSCEMNPMIL